MLIYPTLPRIPYLNHRCQHFDSIGRHSVGQRVMGRIGLGLGIKSGIRRLVHPPVATDSPLGVSSQFAEGTWVRVRDEQSIRQTLDGKSCLRRLLFAPRQWTTCSNVYRVVKRLRRVIDDNGRMRPVSHSVLLSGVDCTGDDGRGGCGRHCPMWYRDEWLEPATPPTDEPSGPSGSVRFARVLPLEQIVRRLNLFGQRDGLMFMAEMARYVGTKAAVRWQVSQVFEYDRWVELPCAVYILDGLDCTGGILGGDGPCDRVCPLLWHADWLKLDA